MIYEILVEQILLMSKTDERPIHYVEEDERVELYLQYNGWVYHATYYRPNVEELEEDSPDPYIFWKQQYLSNAIKVMSVKDKNIILRVE